MSKAYTVQVPFRGVIGVPLKQEVLVTTVEQALALLWTVAKQDRPDWARLDMLLTLEFRFETGDAVAYQHKGGCDQWEAKEWVKGVMAQVFGGAEKNDVAVGQVELTMKFNEGKQWYFQA